MPAADDVPVVPRAPEADPSGVFAERLAALRGDPRVVFGVVAAVAVAAVVVWLRPGGAPPPARPVDGQASAAPTTATTMRTAATARLLVHVTGAVRSPGVVDLPGDARVVDAIEAAGGADDSADVQQLNLAAPVTDGARVLVPRVGEVLPAPASSAGPTGAPPGASDAPTGEEPLDLNAASAAQLEELPGIGPTLAEAIVRERERLGRFERVEDLQRVRGIGEKRFAELRDLVRV